VTGPDHQTSAAPSWISRRLRLDVEGVQLDLALAEHLGVPDRRRQVEDNGGGGGGRDGELSRADAPLLALHGFGGTKEDWADAVSEPALQGRRLIAYDAPGCGGSRASDLTAVSVPFLAATARAVLQALHVGQFHVVGHSMGGLTALLLADAEPARVLSFTDVEGNLAPEDCFLSRQVNSHPHPDPKAFLASFIERVWASPEPSSALYAASVAHKVDAEVVRAVFTSMVDLSDHGHLLQRFLALPMTRTFVHGAYNDHLSYLSSLQTAGVDVVQVPRSGHWPMYSNPLVLWQALATTIERSTTQLS